MQARTISVSAAGVVSDPAGGAAYFTLSPDDASFFVGLSGSYTSLSLQLQGSRKDVWYDVATYTTDQAGPLPGPLAPADGSSIAYVGDCRAFSRLRVNVLAITGTLTLEVLTGGFFTPGPPPNNSAQVVYGLRYVASILTGWLGPPQGPLPALPPNLVGTNPGGAFPGGE